MRKSIQHKTAESNKWNYQLWLQKISSPIDVCVTNNHEPWHLSTPPWWVHGLSHEFQVLLNETWSIFLKYIPLYLLSQPLLSKMWWKFPEEKCFPHKVYISQSPIHAGFFDILISCFHWLKNVLWSFCFLSEAKMVSIQLFDLSHTLRALYEVVVDGVKTRMPSE